MSVSVAAPCARRLTDVPSLPRTVDAARTMSVACYLLDLAGGGVERRSLELRGHGVDVTLVLHRLRGQLLDQVPPGLRTVDLNGSRTLMDVVGRSAVRPLYSNLAGFQP